MANFQLPRTTILDTNGNPVSGAKLNFYITGTSTPKTVYQDAAYATPHANPVVADSAGRVAPIYLAADTNYKLVLTDAANATIYTADPVEPLQVLGASSASTATRILQIASSPLDFGAVGDGIANEAAAVQNAINGATGTIDLLGKIYRCDVALTLSSGKRLVNGTLDFSACPPASYANCLIASGAGLGTPAALTADCALGANQLTVSSTSGLAAGNWLRLYSNATWYTGVDDGELACIKSVDSSTGLTLTSKTLGSYSASSGASVSRISAIQNVVIEDVRLLGAQTSAPQVGLYIAYAEDITLRNVRVSGFNSRGIEVRYCVYSHISDCDIRKTQSAADGVGISISRGSRNLTIHNCRTDLCPIGIEIGGYTALPPRLITVDSCVISGSTVAGIWLKNSSQYIAVTNCIIACGSAANSDGGVDNGCDNLWRGNIIRHPTRYGALIVPQRSLAYTTSGGGTPASKLDEVSCAFLDNLVELPGLDGIRLTTDASSLNLAGIDIRGNRVNGAGGSGIFANIVDKNATNLRLDNNILSGCTDIPIYLNVAAAKTLKRYSVCGNQLEGHGNTKDGIQVLGGDASSIVGGRVAGNSVKGGNRGIKLSNANATVCQGNEIDGTASYGISCEATAAGSVVRNVISGNAINATVAAAIRVLDASLLSITGNDIVPTNIGIQYDNNAAQTDINMSGNRVSAGGSGNSIYVPGTGDISRLSIDGNSLTTSTGRPIVVTADTGKTITGLSITGNNLTVTGQSSFGILLTAEGTITKFGVHGNVVNNAGSTHGEACIDCTGNNVISNGAISGNTLIGGDYAAKQDTVTITAVHLHSNSMIGGAAGTVSGAFTYDAVSNTEADLPNLY